MKRWPAVLPALLMLLPPLAPGAEDANAAARDLARKLAAFAGRGESATVTFRNTSSLPSSQAAQIRGEFDAGLRDSGLRLSEIAPTVDARLTLSESAAEFLLITEARKGEERQVWIASWKRQATQVSEVPVNLTKQLLWEQPEPILDVALAPGRAAILSPLKITWFTRSDTTWTQSAESSIPNSKGWPRDPRGRMRFAGNSLVALLPGVTCRASDSGPAECKPSDDPWTLESGRNLLLANFAAGRNHFDGRITTQAGVRKTVAPFFSAAAVEDRGAVSWILALTSGRAQVFDAAFEPVGAIENWGSDITGIRCGAGSVVLATRPSEASSADAIQAFYVRGGLAVPAGPAVEFAGPVTALWPATDGTIAVVHDLTTRRYSAYLVTLACSL